MEKQGDSYYGGHEWDWCFLCHRPLGLIKWRQFSCEWDALVHWECPWATDPLERAITAREFGWKTPMAEPCASDGGCEE